MGPPQHSECAEAHRRQARLPGRIRFLVYPASHDYCYTPKPARACADQFLKHVFSIVASVIIKCTATAKRHARHPQHLASYLGYYQHPLAGTLVKYEPSLHYSITSFGVSCEGVSDPHSGERGKALFVSIQSTGSKAWLVL